MSDHRRDPVSVEHFVTRFADLLVVAGVGRMPAKVFAALMTTDSGIATAADLAGMLRVSPAAISGAVNYLIGVAMIERRRPIGARRDEYSLRAGNWYEMLADRDALLTSWSTTVSAGISAVGADTPAGRRMAETAAFFDFMHAELGDVLDRWQQQRQLLGFGVH